jgi:dihydrolipoamide dehydrogenase
MKNTELLIIGAGPGGYPAAFHAADRGIEVTLVDPEPNPGGVCLYRGCVPSKVLLHVTAFLHQVEQSAAWGVQLDEPQIDVKKLQAWKNSVVENLTRGVGALTRQRKINYIRGRARLLDARKARIVPAEGKASEVAFENAIVATGSEPARLPDVPESPRVITSREALGLRKIPERLLVVGGGYIGLELGQFYASVGAKVTLAERLPDLLVGADRDLVGILQARLEKQFEAILVETRVKSMKKTRSGIKVAFDGKTEDESIFDHVMISVGRKPLTREIGLENTAVTLDRSGFIETDGQRRTAEASIFAIGDVAGEPMLAHKATHEARVAVEAIAGGKAVFEPNAIPFVVFSDPEIAWCGLSESAAKQKRREVAIARFPWKASGRAATVARQDGLTKIVSDPASGRILGVGIAGLHAGELLAEGVLAMELGAVADDLALTIHTHPTFSETIMEAAQAVAGHSTHWKGKPGDQTIG